MEPHTCKCDESNQDNEIDSFDFLVTFSDSTIHLLTIGNLYKFRPDSGRNGQHRTETGNGPDGTRKDTRPCIGARPSFSLWRRAGDWRTLAESEKVPSAYHGGGG